MRGPSFGYLDDGQRPLYVGVYPALESAKGTVLLCGPLCLEATHAAPVWNRWARQLAEQGWNAVRLDWSGSSESGGDFEAVGFEDWLSDLERVYQQLNASTSGPIVLMGLRGGALVAAQAFSKGLGAALVLWEAPASGQAHLMEVLRRKLAADYALSTSGPRKTRDDYVRDLQAGGIVEVEGFRWTRQFWDSLEKVKLPELTKGRPSLVVASRSHTIPRPPFWQDTVHFCPQITSWTDATLSFLNSLPRSGAAAPCSLPLADTATFGDVTRRVFTMTYLYFTLVGTQHVANHSSSRALVLPNFGYVPRNGHSSMAIRICDQVAARGIHGIRVDLPGLGDSDGELPEDLQQWAADVRAGAMAPVILAVMDELKQQHMIEQIILGGLCAASITSLHAFAIRPRQVSALMLLEPEFFTEESAGSAEEVSPTDDSRNPLGKAWERMFSKAHRLFTVWGWMRVVAGENEFMRNLPITRTIIRRLLWLQNRNLPPRTNLALVSAWQSAVRSRLPILVITAQGRMRELFFERVNLFAVPDFESLAGPGQAIRYLRIPGTNHTFTTGDASGHVTQTAADWAQATLNHVGH